MFRLFLIFSFLFVSILSVAKDNNNSPLYTYSDYDAIRNTQNERDEKIIVARKAEIKFHEILNAYRVKLGKNPLNWLDLHWVAAFNHNNWMAQNDMLSHYQSVGTSLFSGKSPGDRIRFANDQNYSMRYSGENCLYNWTGYVSGKIEEKAEKIAKLLFHQWKSSPGHYANMINDNHEGHAVAFYIESSGKIWGTSLFGSIHKKFKASTSETRKNDAVRYIASGFNENELVIRGEDSGLFDSSVRLSSGNIKKHLLEELAFRNKPTLASEKKYITKAAEKHANYLASYRTTGEFQNKNRKLFYGELPKNRLNKASFFWSFLTGKSKRAMEASTTFAFRDNIISTEQILREVDLALEKQFEGKQNYSKYGYGIKVRKRNQTYLITVVKIII